MSGGDESEQSSSAPTNQASDDRREGGAEGEGIAPWIWAVASLVMAIPAAIPLIVIIEPDAVPFVAAGEAEEGHTYWYLVGLSAVILTLNWGFLWVLRRWFNRYADEQ